MCMATTDLITAAGAGTDNKSCWKFTEADPTVEMHVFDDAGYIVETLELTPASVLTEIEDLGGDYYRIYGVHEGSKFTVEGVLDPWTELVIH